MVTGSEKQRKPNTNLHQPEHTCLCRTTVVRNRAQASLKNETSVQKKREDWLVVQVEPQAPSLPPPGRL